MLFSEANLVVWNVMIRGFLETLYSIQWQYTMNSRISETRNSVNSRIRKMFFYDFFGRLTIKTLELAQNPAIAQ